MTDAGTAARPPRLASPKSLLAGLWRGVAGLALAPSRLRDLERFSHGSRATYVGRNRVLVKAVVARRDIAYFVEADDLLLSPWFIVSGKYETELTDYYVRHLRRDSHSIDVGSNFGYFTCLMARFAPEGRVIGVEPDRTLYEMARDNIAINDFYARASIVHAAAGDRAGEMTLHRRNGRSGNTSIARADDAFTALLGEPPATSFTVPTVRVDELADRLHGRVDFIKVDVEGAEPLVVAGATQTIAANRRLSLMLEWSPGQIRSAGFDVGAFLADLAALGLRPYDLDRKRLRAISYDELRNLPYRAGVVLTAG